MVRLDSGGIIGDIGRGWSNTLLKLSSCSGGRIARENDFCWRSGVKRCRAIDYRLTHPFAHATQPANGLANAMKRRTFHTAVATSLASCTLPGIGRARQPIDRSGPARATIGLAAYSLRQYFSVSRGKPQQPETDGAAIDMFGFMDYCTAQGFDAAELTSYYFAADAGEQYYRDLKWHAFKSGLAISGTAIGNDFSGPLETVSEQINLTKQWIDTAVVLGAPHIRIFAGTARQLDEHPERLDSIIAAVNRCGKYAGERGVVLGVENHGNLSADQMLEILRQIDRQWVGMNLDTGNFFSETPYEDIERCLPYAVNIQVKPTMQDAERNKTPADIERIGQLISDSGYQGAVVLEYEEEKPYEKIPLISERLRRGLKV